jgi:biopolymer transport protein ExbD
LRASAATHYDVIARVMGAAQSAGLSKIGFVTDQVKPGK